MIGGKFGGLGCFQRLIAGLERIFFFLGPPVFFTRAMERFGEVANRRRRRKSSFPNSVFIVFVPNRGAALMPGSRCVCSQGIAELRVSSLDKVVCAEGAPLLFYKFYLVFRVDVSASREAADCPSPLLAERCDRRRRRFVASFSPRGGNLFNKTFHCGRVSLFRLVFKEKSILYVKVFENSLRLGGGVFLRRAVA